MFFHRVFIRMSVLLWTLAFTGVLSQYQPECHSLDSVIKSFTTSMETISSVGQETAPSCVRAPDCTSFSCSFNFMGNALKMKVILSPCTSPPQMTFILHDPTGGIDFRKNITHQTTISLPSYGILKPSIRIDFQPQQAGGVKFGIYLVMSTEIPMAKPITTPIVPDQVINTPPCDTTPLPKVTEGSALGIPQLTSGTCKDMDDMLANAGIPSGFDCHSHQDCNGFQCNGTVQGNDLQVSLRMDSCSTPISYNISIISQSLGVNWSHNFTHSEEVTIIQGPPMEFLLNVEMEQDPSGNFIITTISIKGCTKLPIGGKLCPINQAIIDGQSIPTVPCGLPSAPVTTANPPSLISITPTILSECTSWANIIHDMVYTGLGTLNCNVTANCSGLVCRDTFAGQDYVARLELEHCSTPVELWMSIQSESGDIDWQRTVTHNDTFQVPGTKNIASFVVILEKHDDEHVELGLDVFLSAFGLNYTDTLIKDQLITVESCNGTNPTTRKSITGGKTDQTTGRPTMKVQGLTTSATGDRPNKVPITDDDGASNVGIIFGVLVAGILVLCVIAGLLYINRRRRYIRADETALVEDSFAEI